MSSFVQKVHSKGADRTPGVGPILPLRNFLKMGQDSNTRLSSPQAASHPTLGCRHQQKSDQVPLQAAWSSPPVPYQAKLRA